MKRRHCRSCTCELGEARPIPRVRTTPRKGPMRDPKYRAWCRTQPCAVSGVVPGHYINPSGQVGQWREAIIEPAHTERNGLASKGPDSSCVPLEHALHEEFDAARNTAGRAAFDKKYGVSMKQLAVAHYQRFLKETKPNGTDKAL